MTTCVAVIVAHPDDEVLGCGSTIAWHIAQGDEVVLLVLSDGEQSRLTHDQRTMAGRETALSSSSKLLGIHLVETADFPDNAFDTVSLLSITQRVERFLRKTKPTLIYTHSQHDLNIDHQCVSRAVLTAARPQPGSSVKTILAMEILSSTEWNFVGSGTFRPQVFRNVEGFTEIKMQALACYQQEMRPAPHSRSYENIKHQLAFRGHCVGFYAAEAFELVYSLDFK
jgi:LmbE family N-acetylglucosaminyl deacetylase